MYVIEETTEKNYDKDILFLDLFSSLSSILITLYGALNVYIYFYKHKVSIHNKIEV